MQAKLKSKYIPNTKKQRSGGLKTGHDTKYTNSIIPNHLLVASELIQPRILKEVLYEKR